MRRGSAELVTQSKFWIWKVWKGDEARTCSRMVDGCRYIIQCQLAKKWWRLELQSRVCNVHAGLIAFVSRYWITLGAQLKSSENCDRDTELGAGWDLMNKANAFG